MGYTPGMNTTNSAAADLTIARVVEIIHEHEAFLRNVASGYSRSNAPLEECIIDRLCRVKSPEPGANLGLRAVRRPSQRTQIVGQHLDRISRTRPPFETPHRASKKPGMVKFES